MNSRPHSNPKSEHGTTASYVVGFVLSLVFTVVPYYLVVNKVMSSSTLLATILGVAIVQMIVQIVFFLHLGRGPKPFYNIVFFFGTVGIILVTVGGSVFIMNNLYRNMSPLDVTTRLAQGEAIAQVGGENTGACQEIHDNHQVVIKDGVVSPSHTEAKECDTLTITNEDEVLREIAFGPHPGHDAYGGQVEVIVRKGYSKTITLNQTGTFLFHDHLEPTTSGDFTVTP